MAAISVDPPDRSEALARKLGLAFPLLSDPALDVVRKYGVEDPENRIAWPAIFVVSAGGVVEWRSLVETYRERPAARVVLEALDRR